MPACTGPTIERPWFYKSFSGVETFYWWKGKNKRFRLELAF